MKKEVIKLILDGAPNVAEALLRSAPKFGILSSRQIEQFLLEHEPTDFEGDFTACVHFIIKHDDHSLTSKKRAEDAVTMLEKKKAAFEAATVAAAAADDDDDDDDTDDDDTDDDTETAAAAVADAIAMATTGDAGSSLERMKKELARAEKEVKATKLPKTSKTGKLMSSLLSADFTKKKKRDPLLAAAAAKGCLVIVKSLLEGGAPVNQTDSTSGRTALLSAAAVESNSEVVEALLKAGADVKAVDKEGQSALMLAAKVDVEIVKLLLLSSNKSEVNRVDKSGQTAIFSALLNNDVNLETVEALLSAGADVNVTGQRMSVLLAACYTAKEERGLDSVVAILRKGVQGTIARSCLNLGPKILTDSGPQCALRLVEAYVAGKPYACGGVVGGKP